MGEHTEVTKKPIYKKWWFWLIILVLIIAVAGSSGSSENETKTTLSLGEENNITNNSSNSSRNEEKTKYNVGDIYEGKDVAIKYVSVDENFTRYSSYASIKDGYKIIKADFEFENVGTSDKSVSSYNFNCYADGYDCDSFWSTEDATFSATLSSGKKTKGSVYFEVPKDATEIVLEYEVNWLTSSKIEFIVK